MNGTRMLAIAAGLWLASHFVMAQTPAKPADKAAAKAAPAKPSKTYASPKEARLTAATEAQKDAAQRVYTGEIPCEAGIKVRVQADPANPGYFDVVAPKFSMKAPATLTSTGVVRIEDPKHGIWLQAGNKSMLINTKIGQRVADGCMNADQKRIAEGMVSKPPSDGLLGTEPKK